MSHNMSHIEEECLFNTLPTELVVWIMDFVSFPDKKAMRSVCDRWRCILDSKFFQFNRAINGNDSVKDFLKTKTNVTIQNVTFKNITQADWPYPTRTRNHFPQIHGVTLEDGNSEDVLLTFLNRFCRRNLESLRIREYSFLNCGIRKMTSAFRESRWENLCELEFKWVYAHYFPYMWVSPRSLKDLFKKYFISLGRFLEFVTAPKLRKLIVGYYDMPTYVWTEEFLGPLFPMIHTFIIRHSKTLKVLEWDASSFRPLCGTLQGWGVSTELQEMTNRNLNLESLSARFTDKGFRGPLNLVYPCIWGSTGLKTLSCALVWRFGWWGLADELQKINGSVLNKMEETMRRNKDTLLSVSIPLTSTIQLNTLNNSLVLRKLTVKTYGVTFNDMDTNINLRLPTVTHLEVTAVWSALPLNFGEWVVRVFSGLETIQFFMDYTSENWTLSVPTLRNLLRLPRLKVLKEVQPTTRNNTTMFDPQVKVFCEGRADPVLSYEMAELRPVNLYNPQTRATIVIIRK